MALSFAEMKKQRTGARDKITEQLNKMNTNGNIQQDDRIWYPDTDKAGNGFAIVRFLPAPKGEDVPFVRLWQHSFKGPSGVWYIENSLTTIGQQDPIAEYNNELWNSTTDDDSPARKQVRNQKRKLIYIANVYIVKDPANPENEGKVKLFKFGKKVFDKLNEAMNPQYEDEDAMNPFDLWEGANFKIKIRQVDGYRNYDKSEFGEIEPLKEDDDEMAEIWEQCHSLQEQIAPDKFKTYEQLRVALDKALKTAPKKAKADEEDAPFETEEVEEEEKPKAKKVTAKKLPETKAKKAPKVEDDEEDDTMSFLQNLADEE